MFSNLLVLVRMVFQAHNTQIPTLRCSQEKPMSVRTMYVHMGTLHAGRVRVHTVMQYSSTHMYATCLSLSTVLLYCNAFFLATARRGHVLKNSLIYFLNSPNVLCQTLSLQ